MNRIFAVIMLIVIFPLLIVIAAFIKLASPGPVIFSQKRVGQHEELFLIHKFRTMATGTPDLPSDQVGETDPRITKTGRILRRLSLDELPQLWNVIRGEMNFIGPRPALYNQHELNAMRKALGIDALKPGITGWAQVNGRDSISLERKVALDQFYLLHKSFNLDMKILCKTICKTVTGAELYGTSDK